MNSDQLMTFIKSKMSFSHIYQPMIVLTLLENGGEATVIEVAQRCSELKDGEKPEVYAQKLVKYPREALLKHGVLVASERNKFKLAVESTDLAESSSRLIAACRERLSHVK
ncbi:MAG: hypothetical protein SFY67_04315 [Candidatus Melainabacteria bacterium]|nr:hypothetical protein [Candidatus Melainabacteria bacterium]